ncbi:MAG: hypothetical protein QM669_06970 [Siphonobacter sp.]
MQKTSGDYQTDCSGEKAAELLVSLITHPEETTYHEIIVDTKLVILDKAAE